MEAVKYKDRVYVPLIWVFSIVVPLLVGTLMNPRLGISVDWGFNPYILPRLNAIINSLVSVLLVMGLVFIKQKKRVFHQRSMMSAFVLSAIFLVSYVMYHLAVGHTEFCSDSMGLKVFYYLILITHISLSVVIIPLASFSIFRALNERFDKHQKLAR
ncbi:MAG: DUF420 domain-containing protein, partial [Bacteroidota bacterium]